MYEVAPISAIRWAGKIEKIEKHQGGPKYIVHMSEIFEVGPIVMDSQKYVPQGSRFTKFELLKSAKKMSEALAEQKEG